MLIVVIFVIIIMCVHYSHSDYNDYHHLDQRFILKVSFVYIVEAPNPQMG